MKRFGSRHIVLAGVIAASIAALSACAPAPKPTPAPVTRAAIPPRPYPPMGAAPNLMTPAVDARGIRQTVNIGLSSTAAIWNLRSAFNVAALNCLKPQHAAIVVNYRSFLKKHAKALTATNTAVDKDYKARFNSGYIRVRETFNTKVYNYFALPPTLPNFCDAALAMSEESKTVPVGGLGGFAANSLPRLESVFVEFYNAYDRYRTELAAWEANYGQAYRQQASAGTYSFASQ